LEFVAVHYQAGLPIYLEELEIARQVGVPDQVGVHQGDLVLDILGVAVGEAITGCKVPWGARKYLNHPHWVINVNLSLSSFLTGTK
jgi:hypothetical protein